MASPNQARRAASVRERGQGRDERRGASARRPPVRRTLHSRATRGLAGPAGDYQRAASRDEVPMMKKGCSSFEMTGGLLSSGPVMPDKLRIELEYLKLRRTFWSSDLGILCATRWDLSRSRPGRSTWRRSNCTSGSAWFLVFWSIHSEVCFATPRSAEAIARPWSVGEDLARIDVSLNTLGPIKTLANQQRSSGKLSSRRSRVAEARVLDLHQVSVTYPSAKMT